MTRTLKITVTSHRPQADICASTVVRKLEQNYDSNKAAIVSEMFGKDIRSTKAGSATYDIGEASVRFDIQDILKKDDLQKILTYVCSAARQEISKSTGGLSVTVSLTKIRYEKSTGVREASTDTLSCGVELDA